LIEQPSGLGIEVAENIGLEPVRNYPEQKMPWQVRGRFAADHCPPAGSKCPTVEVAKARDLDVDGVMVRECRTDPDTRLPLTARSKATATW
jgi:hypothetical protein